MQKNNPNKFFYVIITYLIISTILSSTISSSFSSKDVFLRNNLNAKYESCTGNSVICGFVTDYETNESIQEAQITFYVNDSQGNYYDYKTLSNESGFYLIEHVVAGLCFEYGAIADGYHFNWGEGGPFDIGDNETVWVNFSMYPLQPETSKVCGYVCDSYTGDPISNVSVTVHWFDIHDQLNYCGDNSDENGFYFINLGAGKFDIYTDSEDYIDQWLSRFNISDYETMWVNFSLNPEIIIEFISPLNGAYYKNKMIFPFLFPLIIGQIDIEINVTLYEGNSIDYVEILIDNISKYNYTSEPYIYNWSEKTPFKFRHTIKIIANRYGYFETSKKLWVWKLF
jgi:hypothetical protein